MEHLVLVAHQCYLTITTLYNMTYTEIDGTILTSSPIETVTYICSTDMMDGVYESEETTFSSNPYGIKQIKITRAVSNGTMTISIRESTDTELQDYLEQIIPLPDVDFNSLLNNTPSGS